MLQVMTGRLYIQTIQLKHFSRFNNTQIKSAFFALFISLASSSYALSHLKNDFRDTNNTYNLSLNIDAVSDNLPLDLFDEKWTKLPTKQKNNNAFLNLNFDAHMEFNNFNIGVFSQEIGEFYLNNGFIQTWYMVDTDFANLLLNSSINQNLDSLPVKANANSTKINGIYLQKIVSLNSNHHLSTKLKLNIAHELNYLDVTGETNSEDFVASLDYYYSGENILTDANSKSKNDLGVGYGIDLEYIYNNDSLYIYLGAFNISSYIYWDNISFMHYGFDSKTIYVGDDGYNHYKPFGVGYYKYNINFKQKLPTYYKTALNYMVKDNFALGYNLDIYESMQFNELYTNFNVHNSSYKLGYILESKDLSLGLYFKNFLLEITSKPFFSNDLVQINTRYSF